MDDGRWTIDDRRWTICPFLTDEGQICHTIFREFQGIFYFLRTIFIRTLRLRGLAVGLITSRCSGERRKSSLWEEKHVHNTSLPYGVRFYRVTPHITMDCAQSLIIHVTLRDKPDTLLFLNMEIISLRIVWQMWPSSAKNLIEDWHPSSLGTHITDVRLFAFMWRCVTKRTLEKKFPEIP